MHAAPHLLRRIKLRGAGVIGNRDKLGSELRSFTCTQALRATRITT